MRITLSDLAQEYLNQFGEPWNVLKSIGKLTGFLKKHGVKVLGDLVMLRN